VEEHTILGILAMVGGDFLGAIKKVFGVAVVGVVVLFVAERTLIKRHIVSEILPMWSMLMAYFLTMKGRLSEIERVSGDALVRLGVLEENSAENKEHRFDTEMWKESATRSIRHELKRCLQESRIAAEETLDLFAPVKSALLKLKNDTELFRAYSNHLSRKIASLWSEKLHVLNAVLALFSRPTRQIARNRARGFSARTSQRAGTQDVDAQGTRTVHRGSPD
jgi:hypothetical protein